MKTIGTDTRTYFERSTVQYELNVKQLTTQAEKGHEQVTKKDFAEIPFNLPMIYNNESDLSASDQIKKQLIEKMTGSILNNDEINKLYPNGDVITFEKQEKSVKAYSNQNADALPFGFKYNETTEKKESFTTGFSSKVVFKTPQGNFEIDLKFSYTNEFYSKHEKEISITKEKFDKPFEINSNATKEDFNNINSFHFIFDSVEAKDTPENDLFERLKKEAKKRELALAKNKEEREKILEEQEIRLEEMKRLEQINIYEEKDGQHTRISTQFENIGAFIVAPSNIVTNNENSEHHDYGIQGTFSSKSSSSFELIV